MSLYRHRLPQLTDCPLLTDGGLETTLVFHQGIDLPCFAAFDLLKDEVGTQTLETYFERYLAIAAAQGVGFLLESPTWRANPDWGRKIGYDETALAEANGRSIELMVRLRDRHQSADRPVVVSGNIGPRGDGYRADAQMSDDEARRYHRWQVETLAAMPVDLVSAFTMNYVAEAVGIVRAAQAVNVPVVISFTVETDGRLPSGDTLQQAIESTDAATGGYAAYYMINCAHPTHFESVLRNGGAWVERIRGLRANASKRSHAELDESPDLDVGNPHELGQEYHALRQLLPNLTVLGGCCGTDHRHVDAIAGACLASAA